MLPIFHNKRRRNGMTGWNTELMELKSADISQSKFEEVRAEQLVFNNVSLAGTKINNANMSEMQFIDINLGASHINDANLSGTKISNANLSNVVIDHVHLFGATFQNIVLPNEADSNYAPDQKYKPVKFENCNLTDTQITNCDLANVEINDCNLSGLKINGILVEELLAKYKVSNHHQ
jgi:uncharacterized protein YjbI with pentapeptide repeats